jgi:acyl-CoA thioester hydrolase
MSAIDTAKRKKDASMSSPGEDRRRWHKTTLRVPLFEVDIGQAVYHGNYYHLFEVARETFLRDLGYPYSRLMDQQLHLSVVEAACSYRRPLRYDDLIDVHTSILWRRSRSMAFSQIIYREEEGSDPTLCTNLTLNVVCVHFSGTAKVLPGDFVRALDEWSRVGGEDG